LFALLLSVKIFNFYSEEVNINVFLAGQHLNVSGLFDEIRAAAAVPASEELTTEQSASSSGKFDIISSKEFTLFNR